MDDLVGTQAPGCRLTDPAESVAELERALPGLEPHRLPTPASIDWPRLEGVLGTALPADYKLLCELYPAFVLSDFILVSGPAPGAEVTWAEDTEDLEIVAEWCEDADLAIPMHPYPAAGGLLPWATSNQGDYFLWTTSPDGPQEWMVTVASRNGAWWHYAGGAVQFLADLVSGVLEPWALPPVRPEITWVQQPGGGSR
ncbi:SMI1/KNR4 family protein [Streptomyces sp. Act143]|uniref:SMI1/KNR4 family protein n=1 Tax=Streptomyces sp. Act143 TaxID=2200760 RepID=UPI000D68275B|nr:SMI1/KNR4 family protein [Streptomyces sp. Act143]PWI19347.1 SMI1/KNR4 family protein [Streptomyces sp. Act143]